MSFSPQIRKYINPMLKRLGFKKYKNFWCIEEKNGWVIHIHMKSGRMSNAETGYFEMSLGFSSNDLNDLLGLGPRVNPDLNFDNTDGPFFFLEGHFYSGLFSFSKDGVWEASRERVLLPIDGGVESYFSSLSAELEEIIPKAFVRYASLESLVECKKSNVGSRTQSKNSSIYAAAACILLGRPDEAGGFLEDAVRPGSTQFIKDLGARLSEVIEERS